MDSGFAPRLNNKTAYTTKDGTWPLRSRNRARSVDEITQAMLDATKHFPNRPRGEKSAQSDKLIGEFLLDYQNKSDIYNAIAKRAEDACREALKKNFIPAIVTSRAKQHDSLSNKLHKRGDVTPYASRGDIEKDLVDLCGVRVALYFPSQEPLAANVISELFVEAKVKVLPESRTGATIHVVSSPNSDPPEQKYENQFGGYRATHLRVKKFKKPDPNSHTDCMIEVQVASLLMHAWSEVNHDLAYKTLNGKLSIDEYRILDGINGIMRSGEIMLGQLKSCMDERITTPKRPFVSSFELGTFVQKYLASKFAKAGKYHIDLLPILFNVTENLRINCPAALEKSLESWVPGSPAKEFSATRSIISYLVDAVEKKKNDDLPTTPFLIQGLNDKFKGLDSGEKYIIQAEILDYAIHQGLKSIKEDDFPRVPCDSLKSKGLLLIGTKKAEHPIEKDTKETETQISTLWVWFANNNSALTRMALGVGRAKGGKDFEGRCDGRV